MWKPVDSGSFLPVALPPRLKLAARLPVLASVAVPDGPVGAETFSAGIIPEHTRE